MRFWTDDMDPNFLDIQENPQFEEGQDTSTETLEQKSYKVVLFNDELHTYDYVVELLTKCCELARDAAFRCAVEVDLTGRTIVYYGKHESCLDVQKKITSYGADYRLPASMGSMNAEVQVH